MASHRTEPKPISDAAFRRAVITYLSALAVTLALLAGCGDHVLGLY